MGGGGMDSNTSENLIIGVEAAKVVVVVVVVG
jgi:hypothetical protein